MENVNKKYFDIDDDFEGIINFHFKGNKKIVQIQTGWTNFVFRVTTLGRKFIFRFPRNDFFSDALIKEFEFNKFIKDKISFEIPNLNLFFDCGRPYSLHEEIEGEVLESCYNNLTNEEKKGVASDIVLFLYELAQIDLNAYKNVEFEVLSDFLDNLSEVSKNNYDLAKHEILKSLEERDLSICHGDLNSGNLILRNNKLFAVIDFAFAGVTSKFCDLARISGRTPKEFKNMLINAYEEKFNLKINENLISNLEDLWKYVEKQYILYIKQNYPTIQLPTLV